MRSVQTRHCVGGEEVRVAMSGAVTMAGWSWRQSALRMRSTGSRNTKFISHYTTAGAPVIKKINLDAGVLPPVVSGRQPGINTACCLVPTLS